jgi:hypothetical protein
MVDLTAVKEEGGMVRSRAIIAGILLSVFLFTSIPVFAAPGRDSERDRKRPEYRQDYNENKQAEEDKEKKREEVRKPPAKQEKERPKRGSHEKQVQTNKPKQDNPGIKKQPPKKETRNDRYQNKPGQEQRRTKDDPKKRREEDTRYEGKGKPGEGGYKHQDREHLRKHWEQERAAIHSRRRPDYHVRSRLYKEKHDRYWHRHYQDWHWLGSYTFSSIYVYSSPNSDTVWSVRFQAHRHQHPYFFDTVTRHYGHYGYKKRWYHGGIAGWVYYWVSPSTVVRLVIDDDGNSYTALWHRAELDRYVVDLGYVSIGSMEYYRCYDEMPAEVIEAYIEDIVEYVEYED